MKKIAQTSILFTLFMPFIFQSAIAQLKPIAMHPENPHYFIYKNKPEILITSGEHYGAVLNLDFDYKKYLEELQSHDLNLTRLFTGAYVEPPGAFNIEKNTLAPAPGRYICPWPRSSEAGYTNGGNKFDLSKWDDNYFQRLKGFVAEAEKRNIIIELALFCPFYEDSQWQLSPMNMINNVNGIGKIPRNDVYTLDKNGSLLKTQEDLVKKLITELNGFSNIIYEICNEPYFGGVTMEWQHHIASLISTTEKDLINHHLISQNIANGSAKITNPHPAVSIFNFHYATPPIAVGQNYHLNKVIGDNETGFNGNADSTYRKEGWEIVMAGGALYNNLDYSFAPGYENGTFQYGEKQPGGGSVALRQQLGFLKKFMTGFNYLRMHPDSTLVVSTTSSAKVYTLVETGKQYAIYLHQTKNSTLKIALPAGTYTVEWLNPVTGNYKRGKNIRSKGKTTLSLPTHTEDVALRLLKINAGKK